MGDSVTTVGKMEQQYTMPLGEIKAALEASIESTQRGLTVNSETRGEINELITQLESMSPNPNPTEAMELLAGSWKLTYTNDLKVIALLGLSRLPFITINDLTQSIIFDGANYTAENTVSVSVPFSQNSFSTRAALEVRSPKRLQLKLKQGTLSTPQLMTTLQLPDTVTIMGQNVDLKDLKNALAPVQSSASEIMGQVANLVKQQPDLEFPFPDIDQAQTWLLTTYLDNDTRIGRGDGGSVFVMQKEMLLAPTSVTDTAFVDDISEEIIDLS